MKHIVLLATLIVLGVVGRNQVLAEASEPAPAWTVTIEDFHGGSGVTLTHVITPDSIRTIRSTDNAGDEPIELGNIELEDDQRADVVRALNRVPIEDLDDVYHSDVLGGSVCFTFELPGRDPKTVLVWQGARVASLKRVVEQVNRILPDELRIRAMDR